MEQEIIEAELLDGDFATKQIKRMDANTQLGYIGEGILLLIFNVDSFQLKSVEKTKTDGVNRHLSFNDRLYFFKREIGCPFLRKGKGKDTEKY